MFNNYGTEDLGELLDESDEAFDEAIRSRGRGPARGGVPTAKRGNTVPTSPPPGYATKADLKAAADALDAKIVMNSKAITIVEGRARSLDAENVKMRMTLKREIADRKATTDSLKKGLDDARQIAMILPLLSSQQTQIVGGVPNVVVDNGDNFSKILPILLLSGGFGGSAGSGTSGGMFGGDNSIGMLALVMAMTK